MSPLPDALDLEVVTVVLMVVEATHAITAGTRTKPSDRTQSRRGNATLHSVDADDSASTTRMSVRAVQRGSPSDVIRAIPAT
jgi:hypothetical protein